MLYIPKHYFSFFGMMAASVSVNLHGYTYAITQLNTQRIHTLKLNLITTMLNAQIQSKTK